jgi:hypothetical protein
MRARQSLKDARSLMFSSSNEALPQTVEHVSVSCAQPAGLRQGLVRKIPSHLARLTVLRSTHVRGSGPAKSTSPTDTVRALHGHWLSTCSGPRPHWHLRHDYNDFDPGPSTDAQQTLHPRGKGGLLRVVDTT